MIRKSGHKKGGDFYGEKNMAYRGQRFSRFAGWYDSKTSGYKGLLQILTIARRDSTPYKVERLSYAINYSFKIKGNWLAMTKLRSALKAGINNYRIGRDRQCANNISYAIGILRNL